MKTDVVRVSLMVLRVASLVVFAALGTIALTRYSPGYFAELAELDPQHGDAARTRAEAQQDERASVSLFSTMQGLLHGELGRSRQFDVPVSDLMRPRVKVTGRLLLVAVASGWFVAMALAVPLGLRQRSLGEPVITLSTVILLAVPVGALATASMLTGVGGPAAVLSALIAVRDFKFLYRLIRHRRMNEALAYAKAQGVGESRIALIYLFPLISREFLALAAVSIVTALSALVPVEVIFDTPGIGQLAWSAAMNRDLPTLLGVTLLMAAAVGMTTVLTKSDVQEAAL